MKKLLLLLLLIPIVSFGQLEIEKPEGWFETSPRLIEKMVKNNYSSYQYNTLKSDYENKGVIPFKYFTKYDLKKAESGILNPSIYVFFAKNINNYEIDEFENSIVNSETENYYKSIGFENYILNNSEFTFIDGVKTLKILRTYDIDFPSSTANVRNLSYYFIFNKMLFCQISLIDTKSDNCEEIFNEVIKKIKIDLL